MTRLARPLIAALSLGLCLEVAAADLRVSVPLPMGAAPDSVWYKLARAITREWKEGKATVLPPVPFDDSIARVVKGEAEVHLPLMESPAKSEDELPFRYSSETLSETNFALYSRKGDPRIDPAALTIARLSKLRIETDHAHAGLFFSTMHGVDTIEQGLRRVAAGDSDGFLFSAHATDPVMRRLNLGELTRTPYRRVKDKMVLAKGAAADELDEKLSMLIARLKDSGEYEKIMAPKLSERPAPSLAPRPATARTDRARP